MIPGSLELLFLWFLGVTWPSSFSLPTSGQFSIMDVAVIGPPLLTVTVVVATMRSLPDTSMIFFKQKLKTHLRH